MSRSQGQPNLHILEALGDTEALEVAAERLPGGFSAPKRSAKAQKQTKPTPASSESRDLPPLIKCPPEVLKYTRFCSYIRKGQRCPEGSRCVFAHDEDTFKKHKQILQRYIAQERAKMGWIPDHRDRDATGGQYIGLLSTTGVKNLTGKRAKIRKTQMCTHFTRPSGCAFGNKCLFAHSEREIQAALAEIEADEAQYQAEATYGYGFSDNSTIPGYYESEPSSRAATTSASAAAAYGNGHSNGGGAGPSTSSGTAASSAGPTAMSAEQLAELYTNIELSDDEEEGLPEAFLCPITQIRLRDPVVAADGYTYERSAIEAWLSTKDTSPLTNLPLDDKVLYPNLTLMTAMKVVLGEHCFD